MARAFVRASSQFIGHSAGLVSADPITLACWGRSDDSTNGQDAVQIGDSTTGRGWRLNFGGATAGDPIRAIATDNTGTNAIAVTSTGYSVNTWHHACAVFTSTSSRDAYIDGGSVGNNATALGTMMSPNRTDIGRAVNASSYFSGRLAEVAIWNVALTANEVLALARGVSPLRVRPASLISYVPIWGLHSAEIDMKNSGATWTVTGATLANHAPVRPFSRIALATAPVIEVAAAGFQPAWAIGANRLISGGVSGG